MYISGNLSRDIPSSLKDITSRSKGLPLLILPSDKIKFNTVDCYQHNLNDDNIFKISNIRYNSCSNIIEENIKNYLINHCPRIVSTKTNNHTINLFLKKKLTFSNNFINKILLEKKIKELISNEINLKPNKIWFKSCDRNHIWYHVKFI